MARPGGKAGPRATGQTTPAATHPPHAANTRPQSNLQRVEKDTWSPWDCPEALLPRDTGAPSCPRKLMAPQRLFTADHRSLPITVPVQGCAHTRFYKQCPPSRCGPSPTDAIHVHAGCANMAGGTQYPRQPKPRRGQESNNQPPTVQECGRRGLRRERGFMLRPGPGGYRGVRRIGKGRTPGGGRGQERGGPKAGAAAGTQPGGAVVRCRAAPLAGEEVAPAPPPQPPTRMTPDGSESNAGKSRGGESKSSGPPFLVRLSPKLTAFHLTPAVLGNTQVAAAAAAQKARVLGEEQARRDREKPWGQPHDTEPPLDVDVDSRPRRRPSSRPPAGRRSELLHTSASGKWCTTSSCCKRLSGPLPAPALQEPLTHRGPEVRGGGP